jgi:DNA polymerase III gamma/tau subunit
MAFHTKYRPRILEKIIGHQKAVTTLKGYINSGSYPSAILFLGPTSAGKSTLARAFARSLLDPATDLATNRNFSKLDLAMNRTMDDIRGIISTSRLKPQGADKRVVCLEEFQGILGSPGAGNAFLDNLESPPASTIYLLTSMEGDKFSTNQLGRALSGRCTKVVLQAPTKDDLVKQATRIVRGEKITYLDSAAIEYIVDNCESSFRQLANILEGVVGFYAGLKDKPDSLEVDSLVEIISAADDGDEDLAGRFVTAAYLGKLQPGLRVLLDVKDKVSFLMKVCSITNFVLQNSVMKGQRHP